MSPPTLQLPARELPDATFLGEVPAHLQLWLGQGQRGPVALVACRRCGCAQRIEGRLDAATFERRVKRTVETHRHPEGA